MNKNKKLYVGNLPYSVTNDELSQLFEKYGNIESSTVITDRFTGRSKGFGFVEFENAEDAKKAIDDMNGQEIQGRTLVVTEARGENRSAGGPREGGGGGGGGMQGEGRGPSRFPRGNRFERGGRREQ
jgi:RNA recognition motif-containing protein